MSRPSDPPQDWALADLQWIAARLERKAAVRRADLFLTAERLERVASALAVSEQPRRHIINGRVTRTIAACAAFVGAASAAIGCFLAMPAVAAFVLVALM